ncbi:MAG: hypothetical protein RBS57_08425 [Desulforhabdus sp.]|jgi:hypothetical protein|nr:hypothetical protein [Desulforhabdus sp.]
MDKPVAPMEPSSRNLRKEFTGKSKEEIIGVVEGDTPGTKSVYIDFGTGGPTVGAGGYRSPHDRGDLNAPGTQEQMKMIGQQSPYIATGLCSLQNIPQPIKKITPVLIVIENPSSGDPSNYDVMQCPRGIYACFCWHISLYIRKVLTSQVCMLRASTGYALTTHERSSENF